MATRPQHIRNRNARNLKPSQSSSSVLARLKSLILNPFGAWVGSDAENEQGKRPRHAEIDNGADEDQEGTHRSKRKRLNTVEKDASNLSEQQHTSQPATNGYLDPSEELFNRPPAAKKSLQRSVSLVIPPSTSKPQPQKSRYSLSPQPTASLRAMRPIQENVVQESRRSDEDDAANVPLPLSRDASMESIGGPVRDSSKSPSRHRFRMRTSMTPQPTGQNFGPSRKEREKSEPPALASLAARPMFVKPPTQLSSVPEEPVRHATVPLGTVAESYRMKTPPTRQRSVLSLTQQMSDIEMTAPPQRPITAAEKALQELDMYKTPLLPSRLRGASAVPEMFKTKPVQPLAVIHDDRDEVPRLGTSDKQSAKRRSAKSKPYSGRGDVKKLLERRKREEKEEKQKEKESAIITDAEEEEEARAAEKRTTELPKENEAQVPERRGFTVIQSTGGRQQSSLRVGRNKTSVYHEAAASRSKRGFSAKYDDEEADDEGEEAQDAPKLTPMFQAPANFSFAIDVSPIKHDASKAKEPPIAALPFSLSKSSSTAPTPLETSKPSSPAPRETTTKDTTESVAASSGSVPVPTPLFASVPPIPVTPPAKTAGSSSGSGIPNFFANSPLVNTPPKLVTTPFVLSTTPTASPSIPASSFFAAPSKSKDAPAPIPAPLFGIKPTAPSLGSAAPAQDKGKEKAVEKTATDAAKPSAFTLPSSSSSFGSAPATGGFSFGAPSTTPAGAPASTSTATTAPAAPFSFGAPKPAEPAPSTPSVAPVTGFSFGAPSKPADAPAETAPKPSQPFGFGTSASQAEAPKSTSLPFSFGAPKVDAPKEPEAKPLASTPSPAPLFGSLAPAAPAPVAATEPPKTTFTFGAPAATPAAPAAPTIEAPKPLFGTSAPAFSFGQQPSSSPAPEASKAPFAFGSSPSPAPPATTEKKAAPFTFGSTPSPAPPATPNPFAASTSTTTEAPKTTFTFGAAPTTPVRPVTPPRGDNEMSMDESPTRSVADTNGKLPLPTFTFTSTTPTSSPFGQPTTPVNNSAIPFTFGASTTPFGKPGESKSEEKQPAAFGGFGAASGTGFGFGAKPAETSRPSTANAGGFSFSQPSVPPINTAPTFSFGPSTSTGNGFGASSTPASPSAFNQTAAGAFNFGSSNPTPASATAPSMGFTFGSSQPASPAAGNAGLPSTTAAPFAFGTPSPATPTFGAGAPAPGGAPTFTLGSAPPQTPVNGGPRQIKKLPSRRNGAKR